MPSSVSRNDLSFATTWCQEMKSGSLRLSRIKNATRVLRYIRNLGVPWLSPKYRVRMVV